MTKIALAYIPVLHEGYRLFLTQNQPLQTLYVLDKDWLRATFPELDYLHKDIRCLPSEMVIKSLSAWNVAENIQVVSQGSDLSPILAAAKTGNQIILTNDDIGRLISQRFFGDQVQDKKVELSPIFLRWDRQSALENKAIDEQNSVSHDSQDFERMTQAFLAAGGSADWWRHVGAVLVNPQGQVLMTAYNHHLPAPQTAYADGDTRSLFKRGEFIEMSTSIHAESALIGSMARQDKTTDGCSLYVTDFPCPYCARVIAQAGIVKLFYSTGYSLLDGEKILRDNGVQISRVILPPEKEAAANANSYSKVYE